MYEPPMKREAAGNQVSKYQKSEWKHLSVEQEQGGGVGFGAQQGEQLINLL